MAVPAWQKINQNAVYTYQFPVTLTLGQAVIDPSDLDAKTAQVYSIRIVLIQ